MKRLITLLFFAFMAITSQAQVQPNLPAGTVPFGTGLFRAPDGDIWGGSKFDGYTNLGNWERVADSLGAKINWSDTTIIASKEWVNGRINSIPTPDYPVESVTGTLVDNTDPKNPVINTPTAADVGALAPGDNVSELTNDAGYLTTESDPVYSGDPAAGITTTDINNWNAKQNAITGAATTIDTENLTINRALISNSSGKVAVSPVTSTQLGYLSGVTGAIQTQLNAKVDDSEVGASNGVAPLGSDGKVPGEYLPTSGSYKGTWDASTNTPTLADGVGVNGDRYRVAVGGTVDLGSGPITFVAGDDVIYNGTVWQRSPSGVTVTSVAGKTGDVVLVKGDVGLGNVDNTSDLDKPISTATQAALDGKEPAFSKGSLVAGSNITLSGALANRLVGSGDVTISVDAGSIGLQTLSLGANAGQISISGGNSVQLSSLIHSNNAPGDWLTYLPGQGFYPFLNTTGSINFPAAGGYGFLMQRVAGSTAGSFAFWKNSANDGTLYFNVGTTGTGWKGWEPLINEEWAFENTWNKNNLKYDYTGSSVDLDTLFNGTVSGIITGGQFTNAPKNGYWMVKSENYGYSSNRVFQVAQSAGMATTNVEMWFRGYDGTGWSPWKQVATTEDIPSLTNYVTTNTNQIITGEKSFPSSTYFNSSSAAQLIFQRNNATRWRLGYSTLAETGGNAGSNFVIHKANDDGTVVNSIEIDRATNVVKFAADPTVKNNTIWHEGNLNPANYLPVSSPAGSITQTDIDNWNNAAANVNIETVIPTTVNFTINWQTDIAPGSTETYAELHGNHFVYSAFYDNGTGEVNYSPAISINRDTNGDIQTVEFGDIQSGAIIIK